MEKNAVINHYQVGRVEGGSRGMEGEKDDHLCFRENLWKSLTYLIVRSNSDLLSINGRSGLPR